MMKRTVTPATPADALAALDQRVADLNERRKAAIEEVIALEAAGVKPAKEDQAPEDTAAVLGLLAGDGPAEQPAPSLSVRLYRLHEECRLIDRAIELGGQRAFQLRVRRAAELVVDIQAAWRKNVAATAAALEHLAELASERDRLAAEYRSRMGGALTHLECEGQSRRANPARVIGDPAYVFLQAARREKLI